MTFFLFIFCEKITREGKSYLRTMLEKCYKRHKLIVKKINLDTEARKLYFRMVKWWSSQETAVGRNKTQLFFKLECFTGWVTHQQHRLWEETWPSVVEGLASSMPTQANRATVHDHFFRCCQSNTEDIFRSIKKGEKWKYESAMMPLPTTLLRPPSKGWCPNLNCVKILNIARQITEGNLKAQNQAWYSEALRCCLLKKQLAFLWTSKTRSVI